MAKKTKTKAKKKYPKVRDRDTYTLTVTFFRSFSADANVIGNGDDDHVPTDSELIQQLRKELQMAYDHDDIAIDGSFDISKINTKAARSKR